MHPPTIVVHTFLNGGSRHQFEKWAATAFDALGRAASAGVVASWRVLVGGPAAECNEYTLSGFQLRAQAAGGNFDFVALHPEDGRPAGHRALLESGTEDLILLLEFDVVILATTITRMLDSLRAGVLAVNARVIPIEGADRSNDAIVSTAQGDTSCVLLSRAVLEGEMGIGSHPDAAFPSDLVRATYCPEAAVFRDTRLDRPTASGVSESPELDRAGSLLENVLSAAGLTGAQELVVQALTVPRDPFLCVVMRTQALRTEALRESLLCLAGQVDGRFELLIVVHDGDVGSVTHVLDDQPEWLKSRTRILPATGGTRSRPINTGIAEADASLIAFLDDDDLVFAHWTSTFLDAADAFPRRVLRTGAAVQRIASASWPGAIQGHSSEPDLHFPYPATYDLADHMRVNMTPFMSFAFPRRFFDFSGGADESLEVCEDWDLSLRAASVLGVEDVQVVTAVYRRWSSGGDSYSRHDAEVWNRDMMLVRQKLDRNPLLLPPGSASELAQFSAARLLPAEIESIFNSSSWKITAPIRAILLRISALRHKA